MTTVALLSLVAVSETDGRAVLALEGGRSITLRFGKETFLENCKKYGRDLRQLDVSLIDDPWMKDNWKQAVRIYRRIAARFPLYTDHPKSYAEFAQLPYDLIDNAKEYRIYPTKAWQISGRGTQLRMWVFEHGARIHFDVGGEVPTLMGATRNLVF